MPVSGVTEGPHPEPPKTPKEPPPLSQEAKKLESIGSQLITTGVKEAVAFAESHGVSVDKVTQAVKAFEDAEN